MSWGAMAAGNSQTRTYMISNAKQMDQALGRPIATRLATDTFGISKDAWRVWVSRERPFSDADFKKLSYRIPSLMAQLVDEHRAAMNHLESIVNQ